MMIGIICSNSVYSFKGWIFEYHKYCGPWPLKADLNPRKKAGKVFWSVWDEFYKLSDEDKKQFLVIRGGCRAF